MYKFLVLLVEAVSYSVDEASSFDLEDKLRTAFTKFMNHN